MMPGRALDDDAHEATMRAYGAYGEHLESI
jgi:hypothetical protein